MFKQNRHTQTYHSIVTRARTRGLDKRVLSGYYEKHHIIPVAMGGSDEDENLVLLTAREHFLCHLLLTRMTEGRDLIRMKHAFAYMALCHSGTHQRRQTGRWFALAREMASQTRDEDWKRKISDAHRGRKHSAEAVEKMRSSLTGRKLSYEHKRNISLGSAGFSEAAVQQMIISKSKTYQVTTPSGQSFSVTNLKDWCRGNDMNYHTAHNNTKHQNPVKCGKMNGWKFTAVVP